MGSVPLHGGRRKLIPPSNKNLEIAEDVAGVAGQQNAAPPWGFACLVDFVESTSRTGSMFLLSRPDATPLGLMVLHPQWGYGF